MAASDLVNLSGLMDDAKCFAFVRQRRWPAGIWCPAYGNGTVIRDGHDDTQPCRQRYLCKACAGRFDDLTGLQTASPTSLVSRVGICDWPIAETAAVILFFPWAMCPSRR